MNNVKRKAMIEASHGKNWERKLTNLCWQTQACVNVVSTVDEKQNLFLFPLTFS